MVVAGVARDGVAEHELEKAKNAAQAGYVNQIKTHVGLVARLGYYEVVHGDYRKSFDVLEHFQRVTVDDVRRVAATYLTERARTVVVLVPETPEQEGADETSK
jgi:zinc protease